jgi:3-hydroxyisobutyrate dehydrogenase-like beta-hydroxyacid dehydrogenase
MAPDIARRERIGLIGAGRMGHAMLKHLLKAGHPVTVNDADAETVKRAVAAGAQSAATPAALAKDCGFVIIAVGDDAEVTAVVSGPDGLLQALAPGSLIAVSSTVAPATMTALAEAAKAKDAEMIDAPICRGGWAADEGALLVMFGGAQPAVARAKPVYAHFCSDMHHLGALGHGQAGKALNNLLLWVNGVALLEAAKLAESAGIDLPKLRDALLVSTGNSAALEDWDVLTFTWALKDMQVVAQMAEAGGLALPLTAAAKELVEDARRVKSNGGPDWTGKKKGARPA